MGAQQFIRLLDAEGQFAGSDREVRPFLARRRDRDRQIASAEDHGTRRVRHEFEELFALRVALYSLHRVDHDRHAVLLAECPGEPIQPVRVRSNVKILAFAGGASTPPAQQFGLAAPGRGDDRDHRGIPLAFIEPADQGAAQYHPLSTGFWRFAVDIDHKTSDKSARSESDRKGPALANNRRVSAKMRSPCPGDFSAVGDVGDARWTARNSLISIKESPESGRVNGWKTAATVGNDVIFIKISIS
ncbi:teichoic acid synthase [Leifsonia xyli subsp. cynodontis DSM 46306]|uniref:Uncharacterized protein n=1 Tax=Leifsonia xyli subsp. cynodontis DSM 46306 TaxID=1389489 RepID=U3PFL3_LEIXC|nr:hypothetical protein [Leifsonia xyli]AGW42433.1 teichoic acid synthase [Leifsonia xyli subsp. cynodontis DSM 46306]